MGEGKRGQRRKIIFHRTDFLCLLLLFYLQILLRLFYPLLLSHLLFLFYLLLLLYLLTLPQRMTWRKREAMQMGKRTRVVRKMRRRMAVTTIFSHPNRCPNDGG
jgi:hypothetical protein